MRAEECGTRLAITSLQEPSEHKRKPPANKTHDGKGWLYSYLFDGSFSARRSAKIMRSKKFTVVENIITFKPRRRAEIQTSKLWLVVPGIGLAAGAWFVFALLYTDYLWFSSVGFQTVFSTLLTAGLLSALTIGAAAGILTFLNLRLAVKNSPEPPEIIYQSDEADEADEAGDAAPRTEQTAPLATLLRHAPLPAAIIVGLLAAFIGWGLSETFLRYFYQIPFGEADPIFGRDIAFYIFTLPALDGVSIILLLLVLVNLIGAAAVYFSHTKIEMGKTGAKPTKIEFPIAGRAHLLGLAAAIFLLVAWKNYLAMPQLLLAGDGSFFGASYTDVHAVLPMFWAQTAVAVLAAIVAVVCIFRKTSGWLWTATAALIIVGFGGWIYPSLMQRFSVAPNELAKETEFIRHNIAATRTAFALNDVEERELSGSQALTAADIRDNQRTVQNIRLWDTQPLLDTFGQIQEIRTYYEFQSVDNDRYNIGGEMQQVMISPRELNAASLPNRNWINEHLTFTHGYGAAVGPVNKVTPEGLPELFVKNLPPEATVPELRIERPEIYFGEMSNDRVYVNTRTEEFSHPAGEQNVFRNYTGTDGLPVGSFVSQLLFASRFGDLKLLLSDDLTAESRVLKTRNIRERLGKVAPYLRFDGDPYLIINNGNLIWIADAYTTSNRYPYSQTTDNINYIRNSVKATVDAYNGTINLYLADADDPIIQTYARIFPGTLKPLAEMPESLRPHLRYPEDKFRLQARVFAAYHMNEPQEFYNKEDQWTIAQMPGAAQNEQPQPMEPYYTIMKLPNEQKEEFILMLPFTPQRKDNLAAWMVARSDGENYGKLAAYRFPKQQLVFGPKQIAARITQDPEISRQLTLWNQRGSRVIFGTLMVIPIKESLIYVQPLYLRAESGKIPELRRVIVASDNRTAMEETLDKSLAKLFGEESKPKPIGETKPPTGENQNTEPIDSAGLLEQAKQQYGAALEAQKAGDWARYGEEIKRLGETLEKLNAEAKR
jgi:uncharacterized protein